MAERDPHVIGARIARRRHQLDLSQVELAKLLSVSPSTVANWERGASYPAKKWGKVEQVLGIRLADEPERWPHVPPTLVEEIMGTENLTDRERRAALDAVERTLASERGEGPPPVPGFRARPEREQPAS